MIKVVFKGLFAAAFVAFAVWLLFSPSGSRIFSYLFWGIIIFGTLGVSALIIHSMYAYNAAFKTKAGIRMEPDSEGGGNVIIDIQNVGYGEIVISAVGVLDKRWVQKRTAKGNTLANENFPIYAKDGGHSARLPLKISAGASDTLSVPINPKKFQGVFSGVFFDIDAKESEQTNKYAKQIAAGDLSRGDFPKYIVRKKISDARLKKLFSKRLS